MKTPYKNLIIMSLAALMFLFYFLGQNERSKRFELIDYTIVLKEQIKSLEVAINKRDTIIRENYNASKRLQYILGVDTLDGIITYKQKLLVSARGIQRVNKLDLR